MANNIKRQINAFPWSQKQKGEPVVIKRPGKPNETVLMNPPFGNNGGLSTQGFPRRVNGGRQIVPSNGGNREGANGNNSRQLVVRRKNANAGNGRGAAGNGGGHTPPAARSSKQRNANTNSLGLARGTVLTKKAYHALALIHAPNKGGDEKKMKALTRLYRNAQHGNAYTNNNNAPPPPPSTQYSTGSLGKFNSGRKNNNTPPPPPARSKPSLMSTLGQRLVQGFSSLSGKVRSRSAISNGNKGPNNGNNGRSNNGRSNNGSGGGGSATGGRGIGRGGIGRGGSAGGGQGGAGGTGGSISFAPVIKVNVPQSAAQAAAQALPAQERLALNNAGGYNNAAASVANAGGPASVQRAIKALNASGGNVNAAMQKTGLSRQVFNNVNKLGGPVTAGRALTAVKKVTVKTAPYVGQNATQRIAPNVYALAPVKKHRKKRMEVKLAELNRVINAVKKKKLISLVAHNVTRTNIHANNGRLKPYYKRVIKSAILKKPFAKIARSHAKKLVLSTPVKKPRRKIPSTNNLSYV